MIVTAAVLLAAGGLWQAPEASGEEDERKPRAALFEREQTLSQGTLGDEALIALNVNKGLGVDDDLASPEALRSAAGYSSADTSTAENSHVAGFGYVSQGWNTGENAHTQGVTNMTAQFGTASGAFTVSATGP